MRSLVVSELSRFLFVAARGKVETKAQVRVLAVVCGAPPSEGYEGPGGVGSSFGGDRVRRGVLGDGFARSGSLGAAMG